MNDAAARDVVYTQRYAKGTYLKQLKLINAAIADLIVQINKRPAESGLMTTARLKAVLAHLDSRGKELYSAIYGVAKVDLKGLAEHESDATTMAIQRAYPIQLSLTTVPSTTIYAATLSQPFQGKILRDWYADQEYATRALYKKAVRLGFVEGESLSQIVSRVRAVGKKEKREAESIIRTATNHMSDVAMHKTALENDDLFSGEEWVSTLDGRTSEICMGRDGKVYPLNSGPRPPAHFNCRSRRVPKTKSWKELGFDDLGVDEPLANRTFVADKRKVKDIPKNQRDAVIGRTTEASYNDWLRTQKKSFVEDVLGKDKAKLYLDGGLTLDKFTDRGGSSLNLKQLRSKYESSFERAGL